MKKGYVIFNDDIEFKDFVGNSYVPLIVVSEEGLENSLYAHELNIETIDQYIPDNIDLFIEPLRYLNIEELLKRHPKVLKHIFMYWIPNLSYECMINSEYKKFILDSLKKAGKESALMRNIELDVHRHIDLFSIENDCYFSTPRKVKEKSLYEVIKENGYPFTVEQFIKDIAEKRDFSAYGLNTIYAPTGIFM